MGNDVLVGVAGCHTYNAETTIEIELTRARYEVATVGQGSNVYAVVWEAVTRQM